MNDIITCRPAMAGTSGDSSAEGSNPGSAGIPLKVVLVEDTPADAYLNVMALEDEGFELDWRRVETAQELATALETGPDLVLADHSMPLLDSVMVIRQVRACRDDIPVVVVTGTIGEEAAVEIMRAGADDYVSKRVLSRLGPVVRRSLEEYRTRRERRVTARALKGSVQRYRALIEATSQLVWWMGADGRIVDIHESCTRFTGRAAGALVGSDWADLLYPDDLARVGARWRAAVGRGESLGCETRLRDRHGKPRWFDLRVAPVLDADGAICEWVAACTDIHDRKESARRIEESEVRYRRLFETAHDGIVLCDETTILEANPKACEIFGLPASELVGRPRSILDAPIAGEYGQSDDRAQELIREALAGEPQEFGWLCRRGDGQVIDCEVSLNAVVLADRRICQAIVRDVTEKKRIQDQARKLSRVVEASPDAILIADAQDRIEYVNPATAEVTGYDPAELMGRHPRVLAGEDQEVLARRVRETLARGETFQDVVVNRRKDGEPYYAEVAILPLTDEQGALSHYVAIGRDITEQLEAQEKLSFLAHHDPLTGLPNLSLLKERLGQALLRVKRDGISVLIIHLDLDRFRLSNELAGRSAGDAVLREVGRRLRDAVGDSGTVARLPGDEFVVKLRLRPGDDQPIRWVERLQQAIAPPVELEGQEFFPSACMGLAVSPEDGHDADTLLQRAETALHRAMPEGPVAYRFWSPELGDRARRMVCADAELRRALEKGEFELHYQPRADMESGRIQGTEALIRWRHPERGLVSPGEFIPLLEETGLVREVGEWVIREACRRARDWASVADEQHRVSVNVSARQLAAGDLEQVVARCLEETGCPGERLEVEITETAVMSNPALAATTLKALQGMGVTIALDDFGQGYSSLGYVKQFTPDVLKIDRAFVREVSSNPDDAAIARAIVAMGHSLRMKVVAEGVESESQLELLRRMGCDQVQGFLFSRPVPAAELRGMLESDRRLKPAETARGYMRTVLLVDDEPNVCAALARVLRADGYRILSARSAEEAFELLAQNPDLGVIVSDQRMPGMVGTDFLARVRELYPAVMRIVLSGYADVDTLTEAVNRGAVYKFLTKPWDNRVLRENIRGAFGQFEERWGIAPERAAG